MKEARIDEVLDNIATESLVYLPESPLPPSKLIEVNVEHRKMKGNLNESVHNCIRCFNTFITLQRKKSNSNPLLQKEQLQNSLINF